MKNIVFVAHEFGLYKGHGGIASYLNSICKYLINNTNYKVHVITEVFDKKCDLLNNINFHLYKINKGSLSKKRKEVFKICKKIKPNYVEIADFLALGLECVLNKNKFSDNAVFVTNNHTASRECHEWSIKKPIEFTSKNMQKICFEERMQMHNSDYCIAPSTFLAEYVKKNYSLRNDVLFFMNPFCEEIKTKDDIIEEQKKIIDLERYKDSFNIVLVSRVEGRKCHDRLIESFLKIDNKNAKLFIIGNSVKDAASGLPLRYSLYKQIPKNKLEKIYFYDFLNRQEQEKFIAIADLTIMPSTFENQPMSMIESVFKGIPVIASKYSGCADYIKNEEMLFDPFNDEDLADKIKNFMILSPDEKKNEALKQKRDLVKILDPNLSILPRFKLTPHRKNDIIIDLKEYVL